MSTCPKCCGTGHAGHPDDHAAGDCYWCDGDGDMDDTRFIVCEKCGGDGGWESQSWSIDHSGNPQTSWIECRDCDGMGVIEIKTETATQDDCVNEETP
jgi:DnaJ-class molecular chaperone